MDRAKRNLRDPGTLPEPNRTPHEPGLLIKTREVARLLGLSPRTVERMDSAGKIPGRVRLGRSKRFNRQIIEAWIAAGCPDRRTWDAQKGGAR